MENNNKKENNLNKNKSYYECKRCFIKFYQRIDMTRHLEKQKKCTRILESFKYKDDEIEIYSLQRMNKKEKKKYYCSICNKDYKNITLLRKHINMGCILIENDIPIKNTNDTNDYIENILNNNNDINNENENKSENQNENKDLTTINNIINNQNINNPNINFIDKNFINNNITINNNININFNIAKDFKDDWDISKIDDKLKFLLLNSSYKFTKTLENILDNEVNLNVLIDNTTNSGFVFTDNSLKRMEINDILKKSMEKIYNHLLQFKNDLTNENNKTQLNETAINLLNEQIKEVKDKYDDYRRIKEKTDAVNDIIKNIYNNKKYETIDELNKSIKKIEGY
jgi:hypothetical protein